MKILLWHVHSSWTTAFVQGSHQYVVPVVPDRGPDGRGLPRTGEWPSSVVESSPADLASRDVDVVLLQRPHEPELAAEWLGRVPGRDIGAVYLEHSPPDGSVCQQRHPMADQAQIPIVHVTAFNRLFWDNGSARTAVIEPGIIDPGPRYSGEIAHGGITLDEPGRRGRLVGADLIPRFAGVGPIDLYGVDTKAFVAGLERGVPVSAHENLPNHDDLLWELARRRVYLHPVRWTSPELALIEAMQMAMPVIALATTAVPELVPPDAGTVSNDVEQLVRSFGTLLREPEIASYMGQQARKAALRRFGLGRFVADWDEMLT